VRANSHSDNKALSGHVQNCLLMYHDVIEANEGRHSRATYDESVDLMLALFRILKNLREREHYLRTRYHREHPHFLLYIALDAIITLAIFSGGYALAASHGILSRNPEVLVDLGVAPLSLEQVKSQVAKHGVEMYWVGSMKNSKYATEIANPAMPSLRYVTNRSSNVAYGESLMRITTYDDVSIFSAAIHGPIHLHPDTTLTNALGYTVTYNPDEPTKVTVRIGATGKIVVIRFRAAQTPEMLVRTAGNLRLLT
jgi:hypothetical protein